MQNDNNSCHDSESQSTIFYRFIMNGILLNVIGIFGLIGNVISIIILSRPQMRLCMNKVLLGLAKVDTVLIITNMLIYGIPAIYPYTGMMATYFYNMYPHIAPVGYFLATAAQTTSVYLTLLISLNRFVAVCHPLRSRSLCTYSRARACVIGILVFSLLYNVPRLWEINILAEWDVDLNSTIYCPRPSTLKYNETYVSVYIHWSYLIVIFLIPFLNLAALSIAIYLELRKANRERARLSRFQRKENESTAMLICVVLVFFVCNVLLLVIFIIESFQIPLDADIFDMMIITSKLLVTINSSVNFLIYVIFGENFQRHFFMLFSSYGLLDTPARTRRLGPHTPTSSCLMVTQL